MCPTCWCWRELSDFTFRLAGLSVLAADAPILTIGVSLIRRFTCVPGRRWILCPLIGPAGSPIIAMKYFLIALQLIVGLGILNVWLLRRGNATPFRGGDAKTLREEFTAYGLPFWFMCVVGVLKVGLGLALVAGIWIHRLTQPAAIGLGLLMLGAFVMHLIVRDPLKKALPSIVVLAMCVAIAFLKPTG